VAVTPVAPGVWRAGTRFVNWYLVDAGADGVTVVDGGLPGYVAQVDGSLREIGRTRADVRAVVLTHGHIDHIGIARSLAADGAAVHLHPADVPLAADPRTNTTDSSLLPYFRWPTTWAFLAHCIAQGAAKPGPMPESVPLEDGAVAAVPGAPLVTHVPGHTDGSCVLEFREHGVVFVGDLLCTLSPATGRRADPQLQTRGSNRSSDQAMASLDRLAGVEARLVLPGHGTPWTGPVEEAVASARRIGCR
jgi:glyoxylase-like metal-dependent hydrolase (beta-lactamase superfamily II)